MKRILIIISFIALTIANVFAEDDYDFSAVCSSGQTLYYKKISDVDPFVMVTYPCSHKEYTNQTTIVDYYYGYSTPKDNLIIPNSIVVNGKTYIVTAIREYAFVGCTSLTSVTIPNSIISIGWSAFSGCRGLSSITIPNSVTSIGRSAFRGCSALESITLPFVGDKEQTNYPFGYIFEGSSSGCTETTQYYYNGNKTFVAYIPTTLKEVVITGCTNIPYGAFYNCSGLISIVIPNSVTNIGGSAFRNCSCLESIDIPNSVKSIGDYAFSFCTSIDLITMNKYIPPAISQNTFANFDPSVPIYIPCGSLSNYTSANYWNGLNFIEDFTYQFEVISADESKGSVEIVTAPMCSSAAVIKAVSNTDYAFYGWSDGNIENPRSVFVSSDTTFTAVFIPDTVTLGISTANSAQGSVSNSSGIYHFNEKITISATANYGYHFSQWSDSVTTNPRTIVLRGDTVIQAQFAANQYAITVGSNNAELGTVSGGGTFDYLATASISATANHGYAFKQWNDGNYDNPRRVTITRDTAFTAVFVPDEVSVEVKSADTEHGTVTELSGVYHFNEKIIISAIAVPHYHFVGWSDGNRQNPRELLLRGDTVLTATFGIDTFSVAANCDTAMGAVSGAGLYSYCAAAKVEAKPAAHHHFVRWTNGAEQTTQEFVVEHDTAFEAVFAIDRHTVALAASDSLCGAVSGAGSYDYGASVQLQATPAANCYFTGWSDGVTTNPRTLTVEGDTNIAAEFGKLQTVNIIVAANDTLRGTVAGTGSYVLGSNATLSATASAHYLFEQWSDGRTDNPRTVRVIADATYTAVFVPMQYNIILSQNNADMGMVSGSGVYSYGERVSCLAKPYPNYHFVQWSNGETANPYEFVVEEDKMLTAYFAAGAVTAIGDESAAEPTIYARGNTIVVENATEEILVYDAMGKLICRDAIHRVRAELRVNAVGVYIVKTGNVVMRVVVE